MMSRSVVLFFALVLLGFGWVACSDEDGGSGGGQDVARGDGGGNDTLVDGTPNQDTGNSDQGQPDTAPAEPCGDVTFQGSCDGDTAVFCACEFPNDDAQCRETGELTNLDCTSGVIGDPEGAGVCATISESFGVFCAGSPGDACLFVTQDGQQFTEFCDGTEPGCVLNAEGAACGQNVGVCTDSDVLTCDASNRFIFGCTVVQPAVLDCDALGGTCAPGEGGGCEDLPADAPCGAGLECADGLECVVEGDMGTCTADGGGGDDAPDMGSDGGADAGSD